MRVRQRRVELSNSVTIVRTPISHSFLHFLFHDSTLSELSYRFSIPLSIHLGHFSIRKYAKFCISRDTSCSPCAWTIGLDIFDIYLPSVAHCLGSIFIEFLFVFKLLLSGLSVGKLSLFRSCFDSGTGSRGQ